jgi:Uma2 family endonuclease
MTVTTSPTKTYTAEEYLALEVESDRRHEYRHGEIIPMTGDPLPITKLSVCWCFC